MSNVVNFPIIPRPIPVETNDDPITALRKATDRCVRERGKQTTALVLTQYFQITDEIGWRNQARKMFSSKGDK